MNRTGNFITMGIGTAATAATVMAGYTSVKGQIQQAFLQDFVGNWNLVSITHGSQTESPRGGIQLERSQGRLIGVVMPGGVLELTAVGQNKVEGNLWLFGVAEKGIPVPATAELAPKNKALKLVINGSKLDKTLLPAQLKDMLSKDYTVVAQKTGETVADLGGPQIEARKSVGAMNRAQQAFFVERGRFTASLEELGVGVKSETENYSYSINLLGQTGVQPAATPKRDGLKAYTGGVFAIKNEKTYETLTFSILCESERSAKTPPPPPQLIANELQCPAGFRDISK